MKKSFFCVFCAILPLMANMNVLVFAGSLRDGSYNKKSASEAAQIAKKMGASATLIDLNDFPMPFYDADLEAEEGMPKHAKRFRDLMIASDQVVIASPEYNGSISGVLKNALDWASRNEEGGFSKDAFKGKKFALMSASPGRGGGQRGLKHLRAIVEDLGGIVLENQVSVPRAYEEGALESAFVKEELQNELKNELLTRDEITQTK